MSNALARREPEEVALLTGPRAASVLAAALAPAGQRLENWEIHSIAQSYTKSDIPAFNVGTNIY